MAMGYLYLFGSLLLLTGEKWAAVLLMLPHFVHACVSNTPNSVTTVDKYNTVMQSWTLDFIILMALLMVSGFELSISTPGKGAVKYEKQKKAKGKK